MTLKAGPLDHVSIPKDKNGEQRRFAFVTFKHECSVDYSIFLFQGTTLFDEELQLKRRNGTAPSRNNEPPVIHHQALQHNPNFYYQPSSFQQHPQFSSQPNYMFMNPNPAIAPIISQPMGNVMDYNPQWMGNVNNGMVSDQFSHRQEYGGGRNSHGTQRSDHKSNYSNHRSSYDYEREYKRPRYSDSEYRERTSSYDRRHHDRYKERNARDYY